MTTTSRRPPSGPSARAPRPSSRAPPLHLVPPWPPARGAFRRRSPARVVGGRVARARRARRNGRRRRRPRPRRSPMPDRSRHPPRVSRSRPVEPMQVARWSNEHPHVGTCIDELARQPTTEEPCCSGDDRAHGATDRQAGWKTTIVTSSSRGSNRALSRMPISIESASQSTIRVIMRGPSSSSTIAATYGTCSWNGGRSFWNTVDQV